jgi:hypothetical protein
VSSFRHKKGFTVQRPCESAAGLAALLGEEVRPVMEQLRSPCRVLANLLLVLLLRREMKRDRLGEPSRCRVFVDIEVFYRAESLRICCWSRCSIGRGSETGKRKSSADVSFIGVRLLRRVIVNLLLVSLLRWEKK